MGTSQPSEEKVAIEIINRLPDSKVKELCIAILQYLQLQLQNVPVTDVLQLLQASADLPLDESQAKTAIDVLAGLYRRATIQKYTPKALSNYLETRTNYGNHVVPILCQAWQEQGEILCQSKQTAELKIGELISMDWKLSVAMASNSCRNLNSPTVTLCLKVLDSDGRLINKTVEMNYQQFKNFSRQVKEMKLALETV